MDAFISTVVGVIAGGGVTYATQWGADKRREQREAVQGVVRLYDRATDALAMAEASRRGVHTHLDTSILPGSIEARQTLARELEAEGLQRYKQAQQDVRFTVAALPEAQDFRRFWDKDHQATEAETEEALRLVAERRKQLFD